MGARWWWAEEREFQELGGMLLNEPIIDLIITAIYSGDIWLFGGWKWYQLSHWVNHTPLLLSFQKLETEAVPAGTQQKLKNEWVFLLNWRINLKIDQINLYLYSLERGNFWRHSCFREPPAAFWSTDHVVSWPGRWPHGDFQTERTHPSESMILVVHAVFITKKIPS